MKRVPTKKLFDERSNTISQILELPSELKYTILNKLDNDQLINICLHNTEMLKLCWDPFMKNSRNWTNDEFIIFRLKIINQCIFDDCIQLKNNLTEELLSNEEFTNNYNNVINAVYELNVEYPTESYTINLRFLKLNRMVAILSHSSSIIFKGNIKSSANLKYFVSLKNISFSTPYGKIPILPDNIESIEFKYYSTFNKQVDNLPKNLKSLKFGDIFDQSVTNDLYYTQFEYNIISYFNY